MTSFSLTARMKYELTQTSKESISEKYEEVKESKEPHVIIYSSCWSYYSQITQIMRSCGLLSAIALKKDRGEITKGEVYELNDDQKETLDTITKEEKKDVILCGKHTSQYILINLQRHKVSWPPQTHLDYF